MADMRIHGNLEPLGSALQVKKPNPEGKTAFGDTLADALKEVNDLQLDADKAIENLVTGKSRNIHETMIALNKAEIAFKLTLQVRNKVLEAYKELSQSAV